MNKKTGTAATFVVALAGIILAPMATAQLAPKQNQTQIMYAADNIVADNAAHMVTFEGRVELLQDDARLRADHIRIEYKQSATGKWDEINTIEATGNIYYVVADQVMTGAKAVYTQSTDTMIMTGDVIMKQGKNVMTGNRLLYNVGEGKSTMDGAPTNKDKGRVRGVFYPDESAAKTNP